MHQANWFSAVANDKDVFLKPMSRNVRVNRVLFGLDFQYNVAALEYSIRTVKNRLAMSWAEQELYLTLKYVRRPILVYVRRFFCFFVQILLLIKHFTLRCSNNIVYLIFTVVADHSLGRPHIRLGIYLLTVCWTSARAVFL